MLPGGSLSHAAIVSAPARDWRCGPDAIDLDAPRTVIRLDVPEGSTPRYAISRAAKFGAVSVGVVVGERVIWRTHDFDALKATFFDRQFAVPLPAYTGQPSAVLIAIDGATQVTIFDYMRLEPRLPGSDRADIGFLIIVALFTGMMLMPVLFDLVFYRILREQFILWHAALVASLAVQLVCSFGLYVAFFDVTLPTVRLATIGSFNIMVLSGVMFSLRFIEPTRRPRRLGKLLFWLTIVFTPVSCVHMAGIEAFGRWPATVYFTYGGVLGVTFVALLFAAWRNDSRTVRFLIVGLSPLLIVALTRAFSFMIPGIAVIDANELLLAATIIEVTATALGVANRFLDLKLDRDRAHAERGVMEGAATHDALTGLLNRRAIDMRYVELRAQGFDTFALIDLDRFKAINDRFGHQVGDAVLVAAAQAIGCEGDRDTIAVRLGGEEFVLLLRGAGTLERAEALRQAIPRQIAAAVPGLDRLVTASMGVLELPRSATDLMDFATIYARADKLLYEAKEAGRNRMLYERLKLFAPHAVRAGVA